MSRAFAESCRIANALDGIVVPGRTDTIIVSEVLGRAGLGSRPELAEAFKRAYIRCLEEELPRAPARQGVLPGVVRLLDRLAETSGCTTALLTGNYLETARIKLEHFGLWRYFAFGAFGGDAAERAGLVGVALARARARGMPDVTSRGVVIVGDTPLDVACGQANRTRTLAVATGGAPTDELTAAGADLVVDDLSDTDAIVGWLAGRG